jgi:hypothetical protein
VTSCLLAGGRHHEDYGKVTRKRKGLDCRQIRMPKLSGIPPGRSSVDTSKRTLLPTPGGSSCFEPSQRARKVT